MGAIARSADYRPDIDGLRALAVLSVILFHANIGCSGGFVGVDIFFVISGFLISSVILKELRDGTFSIITFWERRIRRILPALIVVVFGTMAAGYFCFLPEDFELLGKSGVAQATLLSNVFFLRHTGYFARGSDTQPLLHTWSLAVEEQFYLFFPMLLVFLKRHATRILPKSILLLVAGSLTLSILGSYSSPLATFYLLPTRAWELLIGVWIAIKLPINLPAGSKTTVGLIGVVLVCCSIFFYNRDTRFPGVAAIAPCLGAALIILSSQDKASLVGRVLSLKPVVFIGLISYSLYLWHWPLLVFSKYLTQGDQSIGIRLGLLAASIGLSIASWRYVEVPFRKRCILQRRGQMFYFAGASLGGLLLLGVLVFCAKGFPGRFPVAARNYADSKKHFAFRNEISIEEAVEGRFVELGSQNPNQPVDLLIWGDSHAMAVTPVLDELCRRFSVRGIEATHSATAPVLGYISRGTSALNDDSPAFAAAVLKFISKRHVKHVILAAYWDAYPASHGFTMTLPSTVSAIMGLGSQVFVMKDVPVPGFDVPRLAALTALHHGDVEQLGIPRANYKVSNFELDSTFEQIKRMGATVLDPASYFLNHQDVYSVVHNGQLLYFDEQHLSVEGAELLSPLFLPIFCSK